MLRLSQVRGALLSARGQLVTVTEIATDFGFGELGRFSVEYRKVFGESPSQTLHPARLLNSMNSPAASGNVGYPISHR
jgi:AraC-like DNA-binding protein